MKLLLIFPNLRTKKYVPPPMNIPSISYSTLISVLKLNNISYSFVDANADNLRLDEILNYIRKHKPEFIGLSSNIAFAYQSCVLALKIKIHFKEIKVIMGGPWASAVYEYILTKRIADIVVIGEAEASLLSILTMPPSNYQDIPGIAYFDKEKKKCIKTPNRPYILDLDKYPHPIWEDFPSPKKYFIYHRHSIFYPIITTRGCPYACINCTKIVHGYKIRARSIDHIIAELRYLKDNLKCEEILIEDDFFNYDSSRTEELLKRIIYENFNFSIELLGVRADNVDDKMVKMMKAAGVYKVSIGIESATPRILKKLGKNLDLNKVTKTIDLFQKYDIIILGFFMIGIPTETEREILNTIRFASQSKLDLAYISRILAFPGTKLFDSLFGNNYDLELYEPSPIDYLNIKKQFRKTKDILNSKMKILFLLFYIRFYMNPLRILRYLRKIKTFLELKLIIKNFFILIINTIFATLETKEGE